MEQEDRWGKLEEIVKRVVERALDERGLKAKTKVAFANGKWIGITDEQLAAWKEAYGSLDVEAELKKSAAWIVSNPHLAPKSQFARFLNSWLARQQMTSAIRSIPTRSEVVKKSCAYCERPATGKVNGYDACEAHWRSAMDHEKPAKTA